MSAGNPRKKVLFVAYGGGHVRMVLPVAHLLAQSDWASPVILALTTAAELVRAAGLPMLQFKDFLEPGDAEALRDGERLLAGMTGATIDREESVAYLGLSFQDLVQRLGRSQAEAEYALKGRHAFLPVGVLERILHRVKPDIVVSTSSPRAEHAAFIAARSLGIPTVCLIDGFIGDEALRLGAPGYADATCVLNEAVREVVAAAGADPSTIHCTGNPAFDVLQDPAAKAEGLRLRHAMRWEGKMVILMPVQTFHAYHPVHGLWADADLPQRVQAELARWVGGRNDAVLCIRPRPGDAEPVIDPQPSIVVTGGRDWPLPSLLHAVDVVVTLSSTVGLEGHIAGTRVIQITGTPFDEATPWLKAGVADRAVDLRDLPSALRELMHAGRRGGAHTKPAAPEVVGVLRQLMGGAQGAQ
jgi:hypothetical protein